MCEYTNFVTKVIRLNLITTIAVVDDDASLRDALTELLKVFEFECYAFDCAESFFAEYQPGRFDCLLTDFNMKGANGLELQKRLLALDSDLPIIFMSAQSDAQVRALALQKGAVAYLVKPIDDTLLHRHIISALNRKSK